MISLSKILELKERTPQQIAEELSLDHISTWSKINSEQDFEIFVNCDLEQKGLNVGIMGLPISLGSVLLAFIFINLNLSITFFFLVVSVVSLILFFTILSSDQNKRQRSKYYRIVLQSTEKAKQALPYALDKYIKDFPTRKFYVNCLKFNIEKIDSDFEIKKAENILCELIAPWNKHSDVYKMLCPMISELYKQGKQEQAEFKRKEIEDKKKWDAVPHRGTPEKNEQENIDQAVAIRSRTGLEKRRYILRSSCEEIENEILKKIQGEEALRQLGGILADSVSQRKTSDWAFLGGIADGLAGPGAGAAVALNVMVENAKIEAENQRKREGALKIVHGFQNDRMRIGAERADLEKAAKVLDAELKELEKKVVLSDISVDSFVNDFKIVKKTIQKTPSKVLKIDITLKNVATPDVPEGTYITADGSIQASVYAGKTFVGEATIPLPLYGIECGKTETITGYCPMYMEGDKKYSVEIEPNHLWLMEL